MRKTVFDMRLFPFTSFVTECDKLLSRGSAAPSTDSRFLTLDHSLLLPHRQTSPLQTPPCWQRLWPLLAVQHQTASVHFGPETTHLEGGVGKWQETAERWRQGDDCVAWSRTACWTSSPWRLRAAGSRWALRRMFTKSVWDVFIFQMDGRTAWETVFRRRRRHGNLGDGFKPSNRRSRKRQRVSKTWSKASMS